MTTDYSILSPECHSAQELNRPPRPSDRGQDCVPAATIAEQAYRESPLALANDNVDNIHGGDPQDRRTRELPEHRFMCYLKAQGKSNVEIAQIMNYSATAVGHILRQPWARDRIVRIMHEMGMDRLATMIAGAAEDAVHKLIELVSDDDVSASVQRAAANDLLDRFLGKPTQHIESRVGGLPSIEDVEELQRQLNAAKEEELRIRAN